MVKDESMSFFGKMERKYGKYAIRNLMNYIVIMYAVGVALSLFNPGFYDYYLSLNAPAILRGQVWRLVTFMFNAPSTNLFFNLLMIYLYYSLGNTLERVWGAFRFNVYFFMGVLGHIIAALVVYIFFGQVWEITTRYLNLSILLAFAATFPDLQFMLYFVIPIKAKWIGLLYIIEVIADMIFGAADVRCAIILSLLNFVIFFAMTRNYNRINPREIKRKRDFKTQVKIKPQGSTHHKCSVCGRTEADGEHLEFRYCSKCEGSYEYCQDHLYTHQHVTGHDEDGSQNN